MEKEKYADAFLEKRIAKYDEWLGKGRISYAAKVIPVSESFQTKQWVLPTEQAMEILGKAESVAVLNCECRTHYQRCGNPLEVCLLLNDVGDRLVTKVKARRFDLWDAAGLPVINQPIF
jgi:uncharacterized protein (DUF927 family)